jgi:hypothetical protein
LIGFGWNGPRGRGYLTRGKRIRGERFEIKIVFIIRDDKVRVKENTYIWVSV